MKYPLSSTGIDNYLADVRLEVEKISGSFAADGLIYPLAYYINTGRASTCFLRKLLGYDTGKLACILAKNLSHDRTIAAIKTAIRFS